MNFARTSLGACTTTAALVAALLVASPADAAGKPAYPKSGTWHFGDAGGSFVLKAGKGKSADKRYVSNLSTLTAEGSNGCGATQSQVKLAGKQKVVLFKRGGFSVWGVGKSTPSTSSGVSTIPVTVLVNGTPTEGAFSMVWDTKGKSILSAELDYANGTGGLVPTCTSYYQGGTRT